MWDALDAYMLHVVELTILSFAICQPVCNTWHAHCTEQWRKAGLCRMPVTVHNAPRLIRTHTPYTFHLSCAFVHHLHARCCSCTDFRKHASLCMGSTCLPGHALSANGKTTRHVGYCLLEAYIFCLIRVPQMTEKCIMTLCDRLNYVSRSTIGFLFSMGVHACGCLQGCNYNTTARGKIIICFGDV